jgi:hypothetical protein
MVEQPIRRRVFVLGARFSKAFFPAAPLLIDIHDGDEIERLFAEFKTAGSVLELERNRNSKRRINEST